MEDFWISEKLLKNEEGKLINVDDVIEFTCIDAEKKDYLSLSSMISFYEFITDQLKGAELPNSLIQIKYDRVQILEARKRRLKNHLTIEREATNNTIKANKDTELRYC